MADVAQLVELLTVTQVVAGSSPVVRPIRFFGEKVRVSQSLARIVRSDETLVALIGK